MTTQKNHVIFNKSIIATTRLNSLLLGAVAAIALAGCSSLPRVVPDMDTQSAKVIQIKGSCKFLDCLQFRPTSDNDELDIIAVSRLADVLDRFQQQIDPFLLSNDP